MEDTEKPRNVMIERHLKGRGVKDPAVLRAMGEVHREQFIPREMAAYAYDDSPLPIGEGQTISQPYIVAVMTELLEPSPQDRALEIGTGSGYAAAILSRIVREVFTVERYERLAGEAEERFRRLGFDNIRVLHGDGTLGWPEHAPYDAIVVTAGAPEVPQPLKEQLAPGGRLVIPVGSRDYQQLVRVRRTGKNAYDRETLIDVRFVPLIGAAAWEAAKGFKP